MVEVTPAHRRRASDQHLLVEVEVVVAVLVGVGAIVSLGHHQSEREMSSVLKGQGALAEAEAGVLNGRKHLLCHQEAGNALHQLMRGAQKVEIAPLMGTRGKPMVLIMVVALGQGAGAPSKKLREIVP